MEWYYANNGQQAGPVSQEQLAELFRNGTVKPFDLVWNETMTEWTPIGKVAEFASAAPVAAPSPVDQPPAMSPAPYSPPAAAAAASPALAPSGMTEPPTYLWQSIVCLLLCCWPLAIPALIFATKVKPAFAAGDYAGAMEASKKAKTWCLIAFILGLVVQVIVGIIYGIAIFSEVSKNGGL